jgi:hypothetical protein
VSATPRYTTRQDLPYLLEVGQDVKLCAPVYDNGALVAPTAGTITIYDETGTAVVSAAAVTISGSQAEYTAIGSLTSSRSPSAGWRVEWSLTLTGGDVVRPRSTAYVVRRRLYPTIADLDVAKRVPSLAITFDGRPTSAGTTTYQGYIEDADTEVQRRLISAGRRSWLVVDAWALREVWLTLTIALIYDALVGAASPGDPYAERAAHFRELFEAAWTSATLQLDWDEDGDVDEVDRRTSARPAGVWLC